MFNNFDEYNFKILEDKKILLCLTGVRNQTQSIVRIILYPILT